jgi:hypothetical protein
MGCLSWATSAAAGLQKAGLQKGHHFACLPKLRAWAAWSWLSSPVQDVVVVQVLQA